MDDSFSELPLNILIEDDFQEFRSNLVDAVCPSFYPPSNLLVCSNSPKKRKARLDRRKYIISIGIGGNYEIEDIKCSIEKNVIKVIGSSTQKLRNGINQNYFERAYELPKDIHPESLKTILSQNGSLHLVLERLSNTEKFDMTDVSTPLEYRIRFFFDGFSRQSLSVVGFENEIIIEARPEYLSKDQMNGNPNTSLPKLTKTIELPYDVEVENLRAMMSTDGALEIRGPRAIRILTPIAFMPFPSQMLH